MQVRTSIPVAVHSLRFIWIIISEAGCGALPGSGSTGSEPSLSFLLLPITLVFTVIAAAQVPPPINGLTLISARVIEAFKTGNFDVRVIPLAPTASVTPRNRFARRLLRARHIFWTYISLIRYVRQLPERNVIFYITISGGIGQLLELPMIAIARALHCRVIIHHHSFAYLHDWSLLCNFVLRTAGSNSIQLCLGDSMKARLDELYGRRPTYIISNAMFLPELKTAIDAERAPAKRMGIHLGFLGNIEAAKGIFEFIETVRILKSRGIVVHATVAGPFVDADIQRRVLSGTENLPEVEFVGAVFGDTKREFFRSIDILLFPTAYANEAEPVVILEALSSAVIVLASRRGCIGDVLSGELAACCLPHAEFPERASQLIMRMAESDEERHRLSRCARDRAERLAQHASAQFTAAMHYASAKLPDDSGPGNT